MLAACEPPPAQAPAVAASVVDARPPAPRRSPRTVGCRERTMRLSVSMCEYGRLWLPSATATPDSLEVVAAEGMAIDACLRGWEKLAKQCDGDMK